MSLEDGKLELSVGPCALPAGLRIDVDVATRRSIDCDEPRIVQVLENLLANAIRFTPRGGAISLIVENDGDDVRITVRDTGRGIDPESGGPGSGRGSRAASSRRTDASSSP